jgi:hypothetical protein
MIIASLRLFSGAQLFFAANHRDFSRRSPATLRAARLSRVIILSIIADTLQSPPNAA